MGYKDKWIEDNLGVTRKSLRVFEKAGFIPENKGRQYRDYKDDDIDRIWIISVLWGMGYSIKEIVEMSLVKGLISILPYLRTWCSWKRKWRSWNDT